MLGADLGILFIGSTYPVLFLILLHCLSPLLPKVGFSNSLFLAKPVSHPSKLRKDCIDYQLLHLDSKLNYTVQHMTNFFKRTETLF